MALFPATWALDLAVMAALLAAAAALGALALAVGARRRLEAIEGLARAQEARDAPRLGLAAEPRAGPYAFRLACWNEGLRDTAVRASWVEAGEPGMPAERWELTLYEPGMTAGAAEALERPPLFELALRAGERRSFLALALDRRGRKAWAEGTRFTLHVVPVLGEEAQAEVPLLPTPLETFLARPGPPQQG